MRVFLGPDNAEIDLTVTATGEFAISLLACSTGKLRTRDWEKRDTERGMEETEGRDLIERATVGGWVWVGPRRRTVDHVATPREGLRLFQSPD